MSSKHPKHDATPRPEFSVEDELISLALHDVEIPEGLEGRLLAAVRAADREPVQVVHRGWWITSRRAWLSAAATIVGAAAIGGYWYPRRLLTKERVLAGAEGALQRKDWDLQWASMAELPAQVQASRHVRAPRGWQYVATEWDPQTLAFNLTIPGRPAAILLASKTQRRVGAVPSRPQLTVTRSGGSWRYFSVWQERGVLYVLAMQGSREDFEAVVTTSGVA